MKILCFKLAEHYFSIVRCIDNYDCTSGYTFIIFLIIPQLSCVWQCFIDVVTNNNKKKTKKKKLFYFIFCDKGKLRYKAI
jgi:hypothetical protein